MFTAIKTISALTAIAALAAGSAASAGEFQSNGRTAAVRFGDLDLSKAEGQKQLQQRINKAASRVCSTASLNESNACRKLAIANIKAPVEAAIARAQSGERYADAGTDARMPAH
ncbi:UrcA family protein [Sphingobium sp. AN641]|uniref:UrcA family protein n=1 Tax=Sphingobium sp. AN641 TaxID=3133443 RepID=UPI0030BE4EA6